MDEKLYRLQSGPLYQIPAEDADRLLTLADGDCALLYLSLLRSGGVLDARNAARALGRTEREIREAVEKLRGIGLLSAEGRAFPEPAEELPEYRAEDIVRRSQEDRSFRGLVAEAQAKLGHALSGADLKTLFGIYDRLGLPSDVIMLVINRCAENARRRWGEGRLPTMRAIEKEAYSWANRELLTSELAEEYIKTLDKREEETEKLLRALQISGREPTPTERKFLDNWLEMGFQTKALEIAYDRTVVGTGRLVWNYMDRIVRSWHEKGLHSPAEIERGDARPGSKPKPDKPAAQRQGDDLDRLERILKIK